MSNTTTNKEIKKEEAKKPVKKVITVVDNKDLTFRKRVMLVKTSVCDELLTLNELSRIKSSDNGFYSLSTICKSLSKYLFKYDIDLDLDIEVDKVIGTWFDCISDQERKIIIDFSRIKDVEKLQMMANIVQSEGGVKTYMRRYALTSILNLPATDTIDTPQKSEPTPQPKTCNTNYQKQYTDLKGKTTTVTDHNKKRISEAQIKRLYAIMHTANVSKEQLNKVMLSEFYIKSSKDLNRGQYDILIGRLEAQIEKNKIKEEKQAEIQRQADIMANSDLTDDELPVPKL